MCLFQERNIINVHGLALLTVDVGDTIRMQGTYSLPLFFQEGKTFTESLTTLPANWALRLSSLEQWP